jgi:Protein of unknown function (DUF3311)
MSPSSNQPLWFSAPGPGKGTGMEGRGETGSRWWYLLLALPVIGLLAVPIYAREDPELFGFPFFYWYQFAWVPLSVAITALVYFKTRTVGRPPDEAPSPPPVAEDRP